MICLPCSLLGCVFIFFFWYGAFSFSVYILFDHHRLLIWLDVKQRSYQDTERLQRNMQIQKKILQVRPVWDMNYNLCVLATYILVISVRDRLSLTWPLLSKLLRGLNSSVIQHEVTDCLWWHNVRALSMASNENKLHKQTRLFELPSFQCLTRWKYLMRYVYYLSVVY